MFKVRHQGPKHLALRCSWCHWKGLKAQISKMASRWPFEHLSPKLWAKEGPRIKLTIWLPTTKSRESTSFWPPNWECDTSLKRSRRGLQVWFRPRYDRTWKSGLMSAQSPGTPPGTISAQFRDNFGTPIWKSREKEPFGCSFGGASQRILYGGRWWLPPSSGRDVSCGPKCPWLVPTPKGVSECELTTWVVCFDANSSLIY